MSDTTTVKFKGAIEWKVDKSVIGEVVRLKVWHLKTGIKKEYCWTCSIPSEANIKAGVKFLKTQILQSIKEEE